MKVRILFTSLLVVMLMTSFLAPYTAAQAPTVTTGTDAQAPTPPAKPEGGSRGVQSLSGSFVEFDPAVGGDVCYAPGAIQTFCFRAESFTNDWEYVYDIWQLFPSDWLVLDVYVQGTPVCDSGYFGTFSWSYYGGNPYEIDITHSRYQTTVDHCTAYYCFEVISGGPGDPDPALESWYWIGDGYGGTPHYPCSDDGYTPSGMPTCDEAVEPQAAIPPCGPLMLTPEFQFVEGCNCEEQEHGLTVLNNDDVDVTVVLTYTMEGPGTGGGPPNLGPIPPGGSVPFPVNLRLSACAVPSDVITMTIEALALETGETATATIVKHFTEGGWEWLPEGIPMGELPADWWGMGDGIENYGDPNMYWWMTNGVYAGGISSQSWYWDWSAMAWMNGGAMPYSVYRTEGDVQNNDMYNVGGSTTGFTPQNYNVQHQDGGPWVIRAPAPSVSMDDVIEVWPAMFGGNDHSYLVGGYGLAPDGAYEYDPVADSWTTRAVNPFTPIDYPVDGCFGWTDGSGGADPVIIQLPDTTSPQTNLLVYHIASDTWEEWAVPAGLPSGIWAPDIAMDYERNLCYITGGASIPGGGDLTTFYIYDPATNTVTQGPDFDSPRAFHASWYYGDLLCIAGGVNVGGAYLYSTQCAIPVACPPCDVTLESEKMAPPEARHDEVIAYTIVLTVSGMEAGMLASDPIPPGVEYAGNLTWDIGFAWYDDVDNAVYWMPEPPPPPKRTAAPSALPPADYDGQGAVDVVTPGEESVSNPPAGPVPTFAYPEAVLWDNGPLVTHPGGGAGGADASALQTGLGMTIYGFGHQLTYNYRVTDDFDITSPGGWDIEEIIFFAYQTGSPTSPSPIDHVNYQIWDGPPNDPGSSVVFGDTSTNRLVDSVWSNIYRVLDTDLMATNRPIMVDTCSAGVHLDPGTYWLDWQTGGILTSGPWVPPVTILGQTSTGNAMQSLDGGASWAALTDVGPQGLPFLILGPTGEVVHITFDVTVTGICGDLVHNEGLLECGVFSDMFAADTDVVGEADIVVEPSALGTEVCLDGTDVLTFSICNEGDCPLDWMLSEDLDWLSEDPTGGTVGMGECAVVDVTFDATGLAAGDYSGDLTIDSNDPDMPTMDLPVALTVLEEVTIESVTWMTDGCQVDFSAMAAGGSGDYSYAWDFGDGFGDVGPDVSHTYTAPGGCYTVTLDVTDECGTASWEELVCATCEIPTEYYYIYLPIVIRD